MLPTVAPASLGTGRVSFPLLFTGAAHTSSSGAGVDQAKAQMGS